MPATKKEAKTKETTKEFNKGAMSKTTSRKRVKSASPKATKKVNAKIPKTIDKTKKPLKHISVTKKTIAEGIDLNLSELRKEKKRKIEENQTPVQDDICNAPAFYDYDYGVEKIVFLPIDPLFGFVYWDFKATTLEHAFAYKEANLILRFYDVTNINFNGQNANETWDVKVYGHRGTWYFNHDRGDRNLIVEIGVLEFNGNFTSFSRSNITYFPSNEVSKSDNIQWMTVDADGNKVISDIEKFTKADLKLLKKILGDDLYDIVFVKKEISMLDDNYRVFTEETVNVTGVGGISSFFNKD